MRNSTDNVIERLQKRARAGKGMVLPPAQVNELASTVLALSIQVNTLHHLRTVYREALTAAGVDPDEAINRRQGE